MVFLCNIHPQRVETPHPRPSQVAAAGPDVEVISTGSAAHPWLNCQKDYVDDVHPTECLVDQSAGEKAGENVK